MLEDAVEKVEAAYRAHGILQRSLLDSYLRGCDFNYPVIDVPFERGAVFVIYVRDGGDPGRHATLVGAQPETLGIMIEGRHREVFEVQESFTVVQTAIADFEAGLIPDVGGRGGGIQFILPPEWQTKVARIS
jgi:hypothetical protein